MFAFGRPPGIFLAYTLCKERMKGTYILLYLYWTIDVVMIQREKHNIASIML